ncbi:MAG: hypothetical protein QM784_15715 [Polyangiaceae bacterium]
MAKITFANKSKLLPLAEKAIADAKAIAPDRAETYYNEAILTQEFKAKGIDDESKAIAAMENAIKQYEDFVGKASGDDAFAAAVKRSNDRIQDLRDTIKFLQEGAEARKAAEAAPPPPPPPAEGGDKPAEGAAAPPADDKAKAEKPKEEPKK